MPFLQLLSVRPIGRVSASMNSNSSSVDYGSARDVTSSASPVTSQNPIVKSFLSILEEARSRSNSLNPESGGNGPSSEPAVRSFEINKSSFSFSGSSNNRLTVASALQKRSASVDRQSSPSFLRKSEEMEAAISRRNSSRESSNSNVALSNSGEMVLCARCKTQVVKVNGEWVEKELGKSRKNSSVCGSELDFDMTSSASDSKAANPLSAALANILNISMVGFSSNTSLNFN